MQKLLLLGYLERGSDKLDQDKHWKKVMNLAAKHGFIIQAYGGTAILATHENQLKEFGEERYEHIQEMNGRGNKCRK